MCSGPGTDQVEGEAGDDVILGGSGSDGLFGIRDDDEIRGGGGDDIITAGGGGEGDDRIFGGPGRDAILNAGPGDDRLVGGEGSDFLRGSFGIDTLQGGDGGDVLLGEDEDDRGSEVTGRTGSTGSPVTTPCSGTAMAISCPAATGPIGRRRRGVRRKHRQRARDLLHHARDKAPGSANVCRPTGDDRGHPSERDPHRDARP